MGLIKKTTFYSNSPSGEKEYIGLNEGLADSGRFIFTKERFIIDEELELNYLSTSDQLLL